MTAIDSNKIAWTRLTRLIAFLSLTIGLALLSAIYHFFGNTAFTEDSSRSIFAWLVIVWTADNPGIQDTSHGPLVVIFSLVILWVRSRHIAWTPKGVWWPALLFIFFGILLHWCGLRAQQTAASLIGLIILLWSLPSFIYGHEISRIFLFPCAYLVFAMPWNFLTPFSFQLRLIAASLSNILLNGLGLPTERIGTAIFVTGTNGLALDVADPCSGIRSLTALCALAAGYAYFLPVNWCRKTLLFCASVPIAVLANVARVMIIAAAASFGNADTALRIYHDFSGYIVFIAAVLMMTALGSLLKEKAPPVNGNAETGAK